MAEPDVNVVKQGGKESNLLSRNYSCKVDRQEKVDVVLQLATVSKSNEGTVTFRFVLVIDVSGSMSWPVHQNSTVCLLDRIKLFAETFVDNMPDSTSLSIVTFSHEATTCMKMTKMDRNGRAAAKRIIEGLEADGGTNISDGLFEGLLTTSGGQRANRDCIILFTDGEANNGIVEPNELVTAYNNLSATLGKKSRVPISAFTIGDYRPYLLREISTRLGCEAFYWLNEDCDFEADLFTPMCLRESTTITDITVTLTCLEGVTFSRSNVSTQYLESDLESETSSKELTYFIHSIPVSMKKNICFSLILPPDSELNFKKILRVHSTFLDFKATLQHSTDHLELRLKPMIEVQTPKKGVSEEAAEILQNTSAYSMQDNKADDSWQSAQRSYAKVLQEKCRMIAVDKFQEACVLLSEEKPDLGAVQQAFRDAKDGITKLKNEVRVALGSDNPFYTNFCKEVDGIAEMVQFGDAIMMKNINWGRLASLESSLASEMPPATGVFDPDKPQPYMTKHVAEKLKKYRKFVKQRSRQQQPIKMIFKAQNMVLSESLSNTKYGRKGQSLQELIVKFGGTAVPHVGTFLQNTILICSKADFDRKSGKVRDALNSKIPIVDQAFVYDCIEHKKVVPLDKYILKNKPKEEGSA